MENLDDYLAEDASAEERQAAEQVLLGLDTLRLQEKVKRVATERARLRKLARQRITGLILLLTVLLGGTAYWWLNRTVEMKVPPAEQKTDNAPLETAPEPNTVPTEESDDREPGLLPTEPTDIPPTPPERVPQRPPDNMPIAEGTPVPGTALPPPPHAAPNTFLRGQTNTSDSLAQQRLNQLWYTAYPLVGLTVSPDYQEIDEALAERSFTRAFIRLQRLERNIAPNDTLTYLKAYTLLEMGEGAEAARLLDELQSPVPIWQAQQEWYKALGNLLAGEAAAAETLLRQIAEIQGHPYQQHALKALNVYEWE